MTTTITDQLCCYLCFQRLRNSIAQLTALFDQSLFHNTSFVNEIHGFKFLTFTIVRPKRAPGSLQGICGASCNADANVIISHI